MIAIALHNGKANSPYRLPRRSELGRFPREPLRRKQLSAGSICKNCYTIKTQFRRRARHVPHQTAWLHRAVCFCWAIRKVRVLENEKCSKILRAQIGKSLVCLVCARVIVTSKGPAISFTTSVSKIYITYLSLTSMIIYRVCNKALFFLQTMCFLVGD